MDWRISFLKKTMKHYLPFKDRLRSIKRQVSPYKTQNSMDSYLLEQGIEQVLLTRKQRPIEGAAVLEFGSGWNPTIPLLFLVSGARKLIITDIEKLLDEGLLRTAAWNFQNHWPAIRTRLDLPEDRIGLIQPVLAAPKDALLEQLLALVNMEYLVPFDIGSFPSSSVDIVVSRAVLEHVSLTDLKHYFEQFRRITHEDGVNCHIIDNTDHRWHDDRNLTPVDFLKYPQWAWNIIDMRGRHNRLRCSEFVRLLEGAGWKTRSVDRDITDEARTGLSLMRLSPQFASFEADDLATMISKIVVAKA